MEIRQRRKEGLYELSIFTRQGHINQVSKREENDLSAVTDKTRQWSDFGPIKKYNNKRTNEIFIVKFTLQFIDANCFIYSWSILALTVFLI